MIKTMTKKIMNTRLYLKVKNVVLLSDYVYDSGITTIEDLQGNAIKFDGIINGTNPDAGKLCTIRKTALKEYNLSATP
ncbi:glycine betaine ABC transporter substrate-binding protein [Methanohalophilus euhalobius]|jgi:5'(3')-deoxyribonucleotidase|uniref:ABC-type glycine betaine transport system substrate-binding domain-containing protein n=1 Tax=Methanohalophilus euhalobius TaxID=51203 RepID=A0A314ZXX3_9EURY|nr:glycine betaine ABC transporter substrate-binding protein [Methanohalophilus euhalobius]PQV42956.1 hypothetical protein B0H22_104214 [Methanohalophilus euhalobius]RNI10378.1 hypothetical protein EDD83_03170 [Methanohalophilus euhalobius]